MGSWGNKDGVPRRVDGGGYGEHEADVELSMCR